MTGFLKFVGLLNAAIWCGSTIFLIIGLPALFSTDVERLLPQAYVGFAAEAVISRYFIVQYCCAGVALLHLLGEWLYSGRRLWRLNLGLIATVFALSLLGGLVAQPRMHALHIVKYFGRTADQQAQAAKSFAAWHGASETANLLVIICLVWYLWLVNREQEHPRFVSFGKIRA